jgi:hypothetical protein
MKFILQRFVLICVLAITIWTSCFNLNSWASLDDDRLDGNIFVLYAGNGSLVPAKLSLADALVRKIPTILVYYLDDSKDCKGFSVVVSRMQEFYGRVASIIPVNVDSLPVKDKYLPSEVGYYYKGQIPQTVILDGEGKQVFTATGNVKYEIFDDQLRKLFDLLPRTESETLKRRSFNEFNSELVN